MQATSPRATTQAGRWGFRVLTASLALWALSAPTASAALVISPTSPTISGSAGATGTFEVTVTNNGPETILLYGFSLEASVDPRHGVLFNSASTNTAQTYVFAGISFVEQNGFDFPTPALPPAASSFTASDLAIDPPGYRVILPNESFGLALIGYVLDRDISPTNAVPVTLIPDFDYSTATVPEPASVIQALLGLSLVGIGLGRARRRRWQSA